jgi:photosystem II stability/assembly factor-like uncharacterized protein
LLLWTWNISGTTAQSTWQVLPGLPQQTYYVIYPYGDSLFVAGINKLYLSADGGTTWDSTEVVSPTADYITGILLYGNALYVSTQNEGVYATIDGGQTWTTYNSGLNGLGAKNITMMLRRGAMLYVATLGSGVYRRSPFFPGGWQAYNTGLLWNNVESLSNIDGVLFAGAGANATLYTRTDLQTSWSEYAFDDFNGEINALLGVVKEGDVLLAAGQQGLYRSDDNGANWEGQPTGYGLISSVRFASDGQGRVWAHMSRPSQANTLRYTDDAGITWHDFEPGFSGSLGQDITYFQNKLYYARGNGLWRLEETSTGVEDPNTSVTSDLTVFPNPTMGAFNLSFDLEQAGQVEVVIADMQGRETTNVFSGSLTEGEQRLGMLSQGLKPGMYQVLLRHQGGMKTGKLMVAY